MTVIYFCCQYMEGVSRKSYTCGTYGWPLIEFYFCNEMVCVVICIAVVKPIFNGVPLCHRFLLR